MKKYMRTLPALILMLTALQPWSANGGGARVTALQFEGIENFSRFEGAESFAGTSVGFGGDTQSKAMPRLKEAGFRTVINLRLPVEDGAAVEIEGPRAAAEEAGLKYVHLPFDAEGSDLSAVQEFLLLVGEDLNQPVYIHCNSATRVAGLWMIGRVLRDDLSFDESVAEGEVIAGKPEKAIAFSKAYLDSHGK